MYTILVLYSIHLYYAILILYNMEKAVIIMKKRVTFTLEEELVKRLKAISEQTMIPQSKLVETAINEILKKYEQ